MRLVSEDWSCDGGAEPSAAVVFEPAKVTTSARFRGHPAATKAIRASAAAEPIPTPTARAELLVAVLARPKPRVPRLEDTAILPATRDGAGAVRAPVDAAAAAVPLMGVMCSRDLAAGGRCNATVPTGAKTGAWIKVLGGWVAGSGPRMAWAAATPSVNTTANGAIVAARKVKRFCLMILISHLGVLPRLLSRAPEGAGR